jgi:hypothetical protein
MRVNVYAEELTEDVEIVTKRSGDKLFYGLRFHSAMHQHLMPPLNRDDDTSGVTFWSDDMDRLRALLRRGAQATAGL